MTRLPLSLDVLRRLVTTRRAIEARMAAARLAECSRQLAAMRRTYP